MVEQLYFLKQFKKYDLNTDDKILIEIYRLFYNENPDFSDKNINIDNINISKQKLNIQKIINYYQKLPPINCHLVLPNYLKLPQAMENNK